jgi:hypothetical protein
LYKFEVMVYHGRIGRPFVVTECLTRIRPNVAQQILDDGTPSAALSDRQAVDVQLTHPDSKTCPHMLVDSFFGA